MCKIRQMQMLLRMWICHAIKLIIIVIVIELGYLELNSYKQTSSE